MLKVLAYAYASGVFSSRRITRRLEDDVAFRLLAVDNLPSRGNICEFRRWHLEDFKCLFLQVVWLAGEMRLAEFDTLSVNGIKIRANASLRKAMSGTWMKEAEQRLEAEITALLKRAWSADEDKDGHFAADGWDDAIKGHVKDQPKRLETIRAAKARLAARQRRPGRINSGKSSRTAECRPLAHRTVPHAGELVGIRHGFDPFQLIRGFLRNSAAGGG